VVKGGSPRRAHEHGPGWPDRIVGRLGRNLPLVALDLCVVGIAYLVPLVIRFEGSVPPNYWSAFRVFILAAALIHLLVNLLFGLYGEMWRYASADEARRVALSAVTAGGFVVALDLVVNGADRPVPVSVVGFGALLVLAGFGAIRFQSRLFGFKRRTVPQHPTRVLIVGAGEAGALIVRDIKGTPSVGLQAMAIVDDDPRKTGRSICEVPVLGTIPTLPDLVARLRIDQVLLAIPSATSDMVRDVASLCERADVPIRVLPSVSEIVGGRSLVHDFRDLRIEDLLGRQQVQTDLDAVREMVSGRRILITGAGGSIGSEIVRQVSMFDPQSLILLDHDETHLHDVLTRLDPRVPAVSVLADIRDQGRVVAVFMHHRPAVVFHAAAHKHVPILEVHPDEAVLTNVIGTANVADAAAAAGVERFVLISTDKAVKPSSVMGASKWFGEQIVRSLQDNGSVHCAVRFGNVLGSRGSVIPTFLHQIERGGPVTVTDARMRRYFMSLQEAVQLVLQAAALAVGGELFTLEMGEPVNIYDLARKVIRLSGRVPDRDIEIRMVGARAGEKLVEELLDDEERAFPTAHPGIMVAKPPVPDRAVLRRSLQELEVLATTSLNEDLAIRIKTLAGVSVHADEPQEIA
jgi:FlaA1/EpsC-like NDP-sugar epimerase